MSQNINIQDYITSLVKAKEFSDLAETYASQAQSLALGVDVPNGVASLDGNGLLTQKPNLKVSNVTALRSLSGQDGVIAFLKEHTSGGVGGGVFYWSATDPYGRGDDNGMVFAAPTGFWVRIRENNNVNVLWFGAKGDGITDDATAIQTAINSTLNGGKVLFPRTASSSYKINSGITIPDNSSFTLEGDDSWVQLDFSAMTTGSAITIGSGKRGFRLVGCRLLGPGIASSVVGVDCDDAGLSFEGGQINSFGTGLKVNNGNGWWIAPNFEVYNCGVGIDITTAAANQHTISGRYFFNNKSIVINSSRVSVKAWFENNNDTEITVVASKVIDISECWFESARTDTSKPPIKLTRTSTGFPGASQVFVRDNYFDVHTTNFIETDQVSQLTIEGNNFPSIHNVVNSTGSIVVLRVNANTTRGSETGVVVGTEEPIKVSGNVVNYLKNRDIKNPTIGEFTTIEPVGGYTWETSTNLISADPSFESAVGFTAQGTTPPTISNDSTTAFSGSNSTKIAFPIGVVGAASYARSVAIFSATSGVSYIVRFAAKSDHYTKIPQIRMFGQTTGFESNFVQFFDLDSTWRIVEYHWVAPSTDTYLLTFSLASPSTSVVNMWVDDLAIFSGSTHGVYLPTVTTIPKDVNAFHRVLVGDRILIKTATSATTPGSVVKKYPMYDETGTLLGYIPIYNTIT